METGGIARPAGSGGVGGHLAAAAGTARRGGSEEHTSELQSPCNLVCRLLLEKKKKYRIRATHVHCLHLGSSALRRWAGAALYASASRYVAVSSPVAYKLYYYLARLAIDGAS